MPFYKKMLRYFSHTPTFIIEPFYITQRFSVFKAKRTPCSAKSRATLKSGNYLSSRQLTASTFGVKELNFCVRNGNRWILFAIITAIVIYLVSFSHATYTKLLIESSSKKIHNYIATFYSYKFQNSLSVSS